MDSAEPGQSVPNSQDNSGLERVGAETHTGDPIGAPILLLDGVLAPISGLVLRGTRRQRAEGHYDYLLRD